MTKRTHNPQAAPVGWTGALLGRFHVTGVFWFGFHRFGVRILPDWLIGPMVTLFTTIFFVALVRIRRAIGRNLDVIMGPAGWWERQRRAFRTLHNFAFCLTERYERLETRPDFEFAFENAAAWEQALSAETGVIVVTGHIGNWELGASLPGAEEGHRVHLVREEELDPRAQEMIRDLLHEQLGEFVTMHFAVGDPSLTLVLREAIERGEIVALQADRPRSRGKTVEAEIFGRPFSLPVGPLVLARLTGAPIVPVFVFRQGRRAYRLVFRDPIRIAAHADRDEATAEAAQRLASDIEYAISTDPHQWFCWRGLWD